MGFKNLVWLGQAADHQMVIMTFYFGASWALGNVLDLLLSPSTELVIVSCCTKSTFHYISQSDQQMVCFLLHRIREDHFFFLDKTFFSIYFN